MTDFQRATGVTMQPEEGKGLRWCPVDAVIVKQIRNHLGDGAAMRIVYDAVYDAVCNMASINTPDDITKLTFERAYSRALSETGRYQAGEIDAQGNFIAEVIATAFTLAPTKMITHKGAK